MKRHWRPATALAAVLISGLLSQAAAGQSLAFSQYHSQDEINDYLRAVAEMHPTIAKFKQLGISRRGREINYLILSNGTVGQHPGIYINATHHGNEKSSTETLLGIIDHLIRQQNTATVQRLLASYDIYLQPLVNPDGHAAGTRADTLGKDPNRDYAYPERAEAESFKVKEIALVKSLFDQTQFRGAIALHSGMEGVLWPWCYAAEKIPDSEVLADISRVTAEAMQISFYGRSNSDYASGGEFIDYAYMKQRTLAVTVEVSLAATPLASDLSRVVERGVAGAMAFMNRLRSLDDAEDRPAIPVAAN